MQSACAFSAASLWLRSMLVLTLTVTHHIYLFLYPLVLFLFKIFIGRMVVFGYGSGTLDSYYTLRCVSLALKTMWAYSPTAAAVSAVHGGGGGGGDDDGIAYHNSHCSLTTILLSQDPKTVTGLVCSRSVENPLVVVAYHRYTNTYQGIELISWNSCM